MKKAKQLTPADKFTGLTGFFKQWSALGITGIIAGLLTWKLTIDDPSQRAALLKAISEERAVSREDTKASRAHGNDAAKMLADAVKEQTRTIDDHQTKVRANQEALIKIQAELLKMGKP